MYWIQANLNDSSVYGTLNKLIAVYSIAAVMSHFL